MENNGLPPDAIQHDEVEWITVRLPVFTGEIEPRSTPEAIDRFQITIMSPEERLGLARVVRGYLAAYPSPAHHEHATRPGIIARWAFAQVERAFQKLKSTPPPSKGRAGKR